MNDHYNFPAELAPRPHASSAIDISSAFRALRKGWQYPLLGCLVFLAMASAYVVSMPKLHQSTAQLLIDRTMSRYLLNNRIVGQPGFEDIGSQVYILKSDSVIVPVVRALSLADDPEFVGPKKKPSTTPQSPASKLKQFIRDTLGLQLGNKKRSETPPERRAVEALVSRLSVYRADVPTVINVTVESKDPDKAAVIANKIAETYLATIREAKTRTTKVASQLLKDRLKELKDQLVKAEQALQTYKITHNLTATKTGSRTPETLSRLRAQLVQARIAMAVAQARIEGAEEATKSGFVGILGENTIITKLRVMQLELASRLRTLEARLGPKHTSVAKLRAGMEELRASIRSESARVSKKYTNEYQASRRRVAALEATIATFAQSVESKDHAQIRLRELQSAAQTLGTLYNNALEKFNQLPDSVWTNDARIISTATPSHKSMNRKAWKILGGALVLGFMLGGAVPVARELITSPYRSATRIRDELGVYCAILPMIKKPKSWHLWHRLHCKFGPMEEHVLDAPRSRFADGIRNIEACVISADAKDTCKVICVASCVPNEGKTTVLANLAASMAREASGFKCLLIDCDLHKCNLSTKLAQGASEGLLEALQDPDNLNSYVLTNDVTKVDFLPCATKEPVLDAAKLLGSPAMGQVIAIARETYDFVIVETPPVMSVVDVKMIQRFVDGFILVLEWGKTRQRLAHEALGEMEFLQERLICVALNKADPSALKEMEAYKGNKYTDYYAE